MKSNVLSLLLCFAAVAAFAQGQVQFRTYAQSLGTVIIDAPVYRPGPGGTLIPLDSSNTAWRAALLGGPTTLRPAILTGLGPFDQGTLSMLYNPTVTTLTWVNFRDQGYVIPNTTQMARVVPGVNWGGTALIQMVAWQGDFATWAEAYNAFVSGGFCLIGASNPLTLTLPAGPTDPNLTYLVGLQPFSIMWVPEPSSLALALVFALGAVGRKAKG